MSGIREMLTAIMNKIQGLQQGVISFDQIVVEGKEDGQKEKIIAPSIKVGEAKVTNLDASSLMIQNISYTISQEEYNELIGLLEQIN